jgi:exodeoxyribonuclease V alpha subunit
MLATGAQLRIALAAPTGKAAVRLEESISAHLPSLNCPAESATMIPRTASTIHSLLGTIPDSPCFRHDSANPLPFDVIIVDEASMVDLALMAKLFDAIPPAARVILLGDKDQLASVEAGALLGDICDTGSEHGYSPALCSAIKSIMPEFTVTCNTEPPIADSIITLKENYRFGASSSIGKVSLAVNSGNFSETISLLKNGSLTDCTWWNPPSYQALLTRLRNVLLDNMDGFRQSDSPETLLALFARSRILCAVRNGPLGVTTLNSSIETILASEGLIPAGTPQYRGKPVIVTRNDYTADLYNGDVGVLLPDSNDDNTLKAFFVRNPAEPARAIPLHRLPPHETAYAMTVHKSQGSEFERTIIIMPSQPSAIVTRELLYTAITRSRTTCELWCTEEVLRKAVTTGTRRSSGIREKLWGQ